MRQKLELIIAVLFLAGLIVVSRNVSKYVVSAQVEGKEKLVVLDPGHGGEDPGKVGPDGTKEKDLNLAIAMKVKRLLEKDKIQVIMTREEDLMLGDSASNKKIADLKARVKVINENAPTIAVSIHQNSYQDRSISGAQVFYCQHSPGGKIAAEKMQKALLACDSDNTRLAKGNDTYYLLLRTEVPTIIVECGFLSNPEEEKMLGTKEYQKKMAEAIAKGVRECLGEGN